MNLEEAARHLGITPRRVRQLIDTGRLGGARVGRSWEIDRLEVEAFARLPRRKGRKPIGGRALERRVKPAEAPLSAFVSGVMDPAIEDVTWARRAAIDAISISRPFQPWSFEDAPASSEDLPTSYLRHVDEADCVVWIVGAETTPAVEAEVKRALFLGKPILIFRVTDQSTPATEALLKSVGVKWQRSRDAAALKDGVWVALQDELNRAYRGQKQPSELARLEHLERSSQSRMIARWMAAGLDVDSSRALAADRTIAAVPSGVERELREPMKLLTGGPGGGKSSAAERVHQSDIARYRDDGTAPIPVFLPATDLTEDVIGRVLLETRGLGDLEQNGASLVLDGLDEVGWEAAHGLVRGVRACVERWPGTTALLTARPFPEPVPNGLVTVDLELLPEDVAQDLVRQAAGSEARPWALYNLPVGVEASIRYPLFAILLGTYLRRTHDVPTGTGDLLAMAATWSLETGTISSMRAEELMETLARRLIDEGSASIPTSTLTTSIAERSLLRSTRVLVEREGMIGFALPMLTQWFAGRALAAGRVPLDLVLADPERLDRWLPCMALALHGADSQTAESIIAPLCRADVGLLPRLLKDAEITAGAVTPRSDDECAVELLTAMDALRNGFRQISPALTPVRTDGSVAAVGVGLHHQEWLTVSWCHGAAPGIVRLPLPQFSDKQPWPKGWGGVRGAKTRFNSTWAWRWCQEHASDELKSLVHARPDVMAPDAVKSELIWAAAVDLVGRGHLAGEPIPLSDLDTRMNSVLAPALGPSTVVWPLRFQWLAEKAEALRSDNGQSLSSHWPGPDVPNPLGGWVWHLWSKEQLGRRMASVYVAAMAGYMELVDTWFSPLSNRLLTRAILPARFVSTIDMTDPTGMWGHRWYFEPLPRGEANIADVGFQKRGLRSWDADRAELLRIDDELRRQRPEASAWIHSTLHDEMLDIFDIAPATKIIFEWLESDLKRLGWLK